MPRVGDGPRDDRVARVDPVAMKVKEIYEIGAQPTDLTFAFGSLWIATREPNLVIRVDG